MVVNRLRINFEVKDVLIFNVCIVVNVIMVIVIVVFFILMVVFNGIEIV